MAIILTVIALALIAVLTWQGWRAGLLRRVLELAGAVASFFFATAQAAGLGAALVGWTGLGGRALLYAGWLILFFLGLVITRLLAVLMANLVQVTIIGWVDRLGGALCGFLIGTLLASVLLNVAGHAPGGQERREAFLSNPVTRPIHQVASALANFFRGQADAPERVWDGLQDGASRAADSALREVRRRVPRAGGSAAVDLADSVASANAPPATGSDTGVASDPAAARR